MNKLKWWLTVSCETFTHSYRHFFLKLAFRRPQCTHHVSKVCTEGACGLVVLHHTVVIQDLTTAVTVRQTHIEKIIQHVDVKMEIIILTKIRVH